MAVKFPSTEYFNALKDQMAAEQARFRRLGFIDTTFGVSVVQNEASRNFVLAFEVFELKSVREVNQLDLAQLDFAVRHQFRLGFPDHPVAPLSGRGPSRACPGTRLITALGVDATVPIVPPGEDP